MTNEKILTPGGPMLLHVGPWARATVAGIRQKRNARRHRGRRSLLTIGNFIRPRLRVTGPRFTLASPPPEMTAIRTGPERDQQLITGQSIPTARAQQALSRTPAEIRDRPRLFRFVSYWPVMSAVRRPSTHARRSRGARA